MPKATPRQESQPRLSNGFQTLEQRILLFNLGYGQFEIFPESIPAPPNPDTGASSIQPGSIAELEVIFTNDDTESASPAPDDEDEPPLFAFLYQSPDNDLSTPEDDLLIGQWAVPSVPAATDAGPGQVEVEWTFIMDPFAEIDTPIYFYMETETVLDVADADMDGDVDEPLSFGADAFVGYELAPASIGADFFVVGLDAQAIAPLDDIYPDAEPGSALPGDEILVTYSIRNPGSSPTDQFRIDIYLVLLTPNGGETRTLIGQDVLLSGVTGDFNPIRRQTLTLPERADAVYAASNGEYFIMTEIVDPIDPVVTQQLTGEGINTGHNDNKMGDATNNGLRWRSPFVPGTSGGYTNRLTEEPFQPEGANEDLSPNWDVSSALFIYTHPQLYATQMLTLNSNVNPGQSVVVRPTIFNDSALGTDPFDVAFYASTDGVISTEDVLLTTVRVTPGMDAFESREIPTTVRLPSLQQEPEFWDEIQNIRDGDYFIGIIIDSSREIDESGPDQPDNANVGEDIDFVQVGTFDNNNGGGNPVGVDLLPTFFDIIPGTIDGDSNFTVQYTIANTGTVRSPKTTARLYASRNALITNADQFLEAIAIPNLEPGQDTGILTATVSIDSGSLVFTEAVPSEMFVGLLVDARNNAVESNEANNVRRTVGVGVDTAQVGTLDTPADNAPNSRGNAANLGVLTGNFKRTRDFVGGIDEFDWYRFNINNVAEVQLALDGLEDNANVFIEDRRGDIKASGTLTGDRTEVIFKGLNPDRYWIKVVPANSNVNTDYRLNVRADYTFTPPASASSATAARSLTASVSSDATGLPFARPTGVTAFTFVSDALDDDALDAERIIAGVVAKG